MGVIRTGLAVVLASMSLLVGCSASKVDADGDGIPAGADCDDTDARVWRWLERYVDTDGDGFGAGEPQRLCVGDPLPQGLAITGGDCAPNDASRWRSVPNVYRDADGDGATVGGPLTACVGQQLTGYTASASAEPDCDDSNPEHFREVVLYADADGDGLGAGTAERLCIGTQLPAGYVTVTNGEDCDDADNARWRLRTVYTDTDGDGFGTGAPVVACMGDSLEAGYAEAGGDCAPNDAERWQAYSYSYRDQDLDGATVPEQGVVCAAASLPPGYAIWPSGLDCDDTHPDVLMAWDVFRDEDNDGVGAGPRTEVCAGLSLPEGYSTSGTDCADSDAERWQLLPYWHRDADGDGYTVREQGEVCSGQALPPGYARVATGSDCDDTESSVYEGFLAYVDLDGDGVGAGDAVPQCTDGTVPAGYSRLGTDCAPSEPSLWQMLSYAHVDLDEDGHTTPSQGELCAGSALPPFHYTAASGNDCDDADPALFRWVVVYADSDEDGVGAGPRSVPCVGNSLPVGFSRFGYDVDDADASVTEDAEEDEHIELILQL